MELQPLHTKIDKNIQIRIGSVILEDPERFPQTESNLYCVAPNNQILWKAEKPEPHTLYTRVRLNEDGASLSTYTTGGHACELELQTGKLIGHTSIK